MNGRAGEETMEEVLARLHDLRNRNLRLAADLDNFRKRARQQRLEAADVASGEIAERLLPVLDDAERVITHVPEDVDERWLAGLRLVLDNLQRAVEAAGVEPIHAIGRPFDPSLHHAIGVEETPDRPEGTVASELARGYRLHDRVLRPSLVTVSRRGPQAAPPPPS